MPTKKMERILTLDSIDQHRSWLIARGASAHTARCYTSDLSLFHKYLTTWMDPSQPMSKTVFHNTVTSWLNVNRGKWSAKTTQRRLTACKSYFKFTGHDGLLDDYRAPTAAVREAHPLDGGIDTVVALIEAAATPEHRALIALCGLVGCRVNEAVTITSADVDFGKREVTVHGKGAKDRIVPVSERAWPTIVAAWALTCVADADKRLVPMAERTARTTITRIGARIGVPCSSHDLRMTFGTAAYEKTRDLRAVQYLLGHASSKTTELYTGVSSRMKREAADL